MSASVLCHLGSVRGSHWRGTHIRTRGAGNEVGEINYCLLLFSSPGARSKYPLLPISAVTQATNISLTPEFNYPEARAVPAQAKPEQPCEKSVRNAENTCLGGRAEPSARCSVQDLLHPSGNSGMFVFSGSEWGWLLRPCCWLLHHLKPILSDASHQVFGEAGLSATSRMRWHDTRPVSDVSYMTDVFPAEQSKPSTQPWDFQLVLVTAVLTFILLLFSGCPCMQQIRKLILKEKTSF